MEVTVDLDGRSYSVRWHLHGDVTFCTIMWQNDKGRTKGLLGVTVRNPSDRPRRETAMRQSAKRACGIIREDGWGLREYQDWNALGTKAPRLYSEIRRWLAASFWYGEGPAAETFGLSEQKAAQTA
jgi:hypothetical protein